MKKQNKQTHKKLDKKDKPWKENKKAPEQQQPHQESGHWPRKIWPTDQEKHKGPKI